MNDPRFMESSLSDDDAEKQKNSGLKLKRSKSSTTNVKVKKDFEQKVNDTHERLQGHLRTAYELGVEFANLMADTRVSENIGPHDRTYEKGVIRKLVEYAITVNGDEQEQEGMGSVSLITLCLKMFFKMRDQINTLSYEKHLLERRVQHLEKTILSSKEKSASYEEE